MVKVRVKRKIIVKKKGNNSVSEIGSVGATNDNALTEVTVGKLENITNKRKRTSRFRSWFMAGANAAVFVAIIGFCMAACIGMWINYMPTDNFWFYIGVSFLFGIIILYAGGCFYECIMDSDVEAQQYFNTNIALVALIVALISLGKGVS